MGPEAARSEKIKISVQPLDVRDEWRGKLYLLLTNEVPTATYVEAMYPYVHAFTRISFKGGKGVASPISHIIGWAKWLEVDQNGQKMGYSKLICLKSPKTTSWSTSRYLNLPIPKYNVAQIGGVYTGGTPPKSHILPPI